MGRARTIGILCATALAWALIAVTSPAADAASVTAPAERVSQRGSLAVPSSAVAGTSIRAVASFVPAQRGAVVEIQVARGDQWRTVARGQQNGKGKLARDLTVPPSGDQRFRAYTRPGGGKPRVITPVRELRSDPGPDPALARHETISVAADNACSLEVDGELWCWGVRQLADDELTDPRPVRQPGRWDLVSKGRGHTCGLRTDGRAYCWGENGVGALGDGTTTDRFVPTPVAGGGTWRTISAGLAHTCGVKDDGTALCWGYDQTQQLGRTPEEGDGEYAAVPTPVAGDARWSSVVAGAYHSCGIRTEGSAWCWGYDAAGQLGDGDADSSAPVEVAGGATWRSLTLGASHTCGVQTDGSGWCWGWDEYGQLGQGGTSEERQVPVRISGGGTWTSLRAGGNATCGIRPGGRAMCWGDSRFGQLGLGSASTDRVTSPRDVSGGHLFSKLDNGDTATCAVRVDGVGLCWGRNTYSVLGDGTTRSSDTPVRIADDHVWAH